MGRFAAMESGTFVTDTLGHGSRVRLRDYYTLLLPYFWPSKASERLSAMSCFLLLGLSKACGVASPAFLGLATDSLLRGVMPVWQLLVFGGLRFGVSALEEAQRLVYLRTKEVAYHEIACRTFAHLHELSLHWHISKRSGVVLRAMDRGISSASTVVDMLFLRLVPTLVEMAVLVAIFTGQYNSGNAAGVLAVGFSAYVVVTVLLTRWRRQARMKQHRTDNEANSIAVESLSSFETVKAFGNEGYELGRYSSAIREFQAASRSSAAAVSILNILQSFVIRATVTGVLLVAALDVIAGRTSVGDFVALQVYVVSLFQPLSWLGSMFSLIIQSVTDMRNLVDLLLETPSPRDSPDARPLVLASPASGATVEFRRVWFAYPSAAGAANRIEAQMEAQRAEEEAVGAGGLAGSLKSLGASSGRLLAAARRSQQPGGSAAGGKAAPGSGSGGVDAHVAIEMTAAAGAAAAAAAGDRKRPGGGIGGGSKRYARLTGDGSSSGAPAATDEDAPPAGSPSGGSGAAGGAGGPPRIVLRDVSFTVRPGTTTALVGHTGSGKSTVARLLFRFYDVPDTVPEGAVAAGGADGAGNAAPLATSGGAVLVDGQDVRAVTQASLRGAIGIVPQDTVLFNDSLAYNIKYGRPGASDGEMRAAADAAQLTGFVSSLPDGFATKVGERGLKLSGGEKQRVAIARAILKNPPILILDEATSALDTLTEASVQAAIAGLRSGRTVITIAHRLSTIKDADEIIVLSEGGVLERGPHEALLAAGGRYAEMWGEQSAELRRAAGEAAAATTMVPASVAATEDGGVGVPPTAQAAVPGAS